MFANEITLIKKITHHKINGITFNTIKIYLGFPWLRSYGKLDQEFGFISMELLGNNSLEILRKLEQLNHSTRKGIQ